MAGRTKPRVGLPRRSAGHNGKLQIAGLEAKAAATIGSTGLAVAAAENKAKVEMYQVVLTRGAHDADKAAILQQEHMRTNERNVERSREDQARHDQATPGDHHQRTYLELAKLSQSSSQPFSPATVASGLMQMAIAPEAPARMAAATTNEPQPIASTRSTHALEPLLLDAAP